MRHTANRPMAAHERKSPDPPGKRHASQTRKHLFGWHFTVLFVVIVFFGAIRWRLAEIPLERDEGEYAYAGQLILEGIPPYQLAYNMKLPGSYAAFAAIMAVFGQTSRAIHVGLLLVSTTSIVLLYIVGARLFGRLAGIVAGTGYALLSTHQAVLGFAAHATHFVVLAVLTGLVLLLQAEDTEKTVLFLFSGLAFGIAFLMKQPGILLGVFAFFYLAVRGWPKDKRQWAAWSRKMGAFLLAGLLPFALTCTLLYWAGVFHNFWFWTFSYARQYATTLPMQRGLSFLRTNFSDIVHVTPGLWLMALLGVPIAFWDPSIRRHAGFVFGLLGFSCAAVCPGLYFRPHYFILLLPAVAIFIAIAVTSAARLAAKLPTPWLQAVPVIVFAAACCLAVHDNAEVYFKLSPIEACRLFYFPNPFSEAEPVAAYVRQHTAPTDTVMVFGSEPEIYFYAHRHSASGYIYTYGLTEDQPYWSAMQKQMIREVEATQPAYVVFVNVKFSWVYTPMSPQVDALSTWMDRYIADGFEEVGMVEVVEPESHYFWGSEARGYRLPSHEIRIFKRKGLRDSTSG